MVAVQKAKWSLAISECGPPDPFAFLLPKLFNYTFGLSAALTPSPIYDRAGSCSLNPSFEERGPRVTGHTREVTEKLTTF